MGPYSWENDANVKTDYCKVEKLGQKLYLTLAVFFDSGLRYF